MRKSNSGSGFSNHLKKYKIVRDTTCKFVWMLCLEGRLSWLDFTLKQPLLHKFDRGFSVLNPNL